jgi:hypothetical protein
MVFCQFIALLIMTLAATVCASRQADIQKPPAANQFPDQSVIKDELPLGSDLRQRLDAGQHGDGMDRPYMRAMREAHVKRALFEVAGTWTKSLHSLTVVRRLYFGKYDGPSAQVTDSTKLAEIKRSGLEKLLEQVALERAKTTHLFSLHGSKEPPPWRVYGFQEFFDDPILPEQRTPLFPSDESQLRPFPELITAASIGDVLAIQDLLRENRHSQAELNGALFQAVRCEYDNSAVIEMLLHAGADVNGRGYDNRTPLMVAIDKPLNLQAILRAGANLNKRDRYGNTAFKLARQGNRARAMELLRASGADTN